MGICVKPEFCKDCPITTFTEGYVPPLLPEGADVLMVGEGAGTEEVAQGLPFVGGAGAWLNSLLRAARVKREGLAIVNTVGCRPFDAAGKNVYPLDRNWPHTSKAVAQAAVQRCITHHLGPAVASRKWRKMYALGGWALKALTGHEGILKWRGSPLPSVLPILGQTLPAPPHPLVIPTLHPAYLARVANLFSVVVKDLRKSTTLPPENYNLFPSLEEVKAFDGKVVAFDLEWDVWKRPTICGITNKLYHAMVVPWEEPYLGELKRIFENATDLVGHNVVGADIAFLREAGWRVEAKLWDTLLMQHLVQPDMRHSLAFVASIFTNKVFWKGEDKEREDEEGADVGVEGAQWKQWANPQALSRECGGYYGCQSASEAFRLYNARDVDASFQIWYPLLGTLRNYGMEKIYHNLSVPAGHECRRMGKRGIRIGKTKIQKIHKDLNKEIGEIEADLPEGLKPYEVEVVKNVEAPPGAYRPKTVKHPRRVKTPVCPEEFTFSVPEERVCGVCGTTVKSGVMIAAKVVKIKDMEWVVPWNSSPQLQKYAQEQGCAGILHIKTKRPTSDKRARMVWGRSHPEFTAVDHLKKLVTLRNNFAKESLLNEERMFFNLLVHGTSEGRLSSSGTRRGIDLNIQNIPKQIRCIFQPDSPSNCFVGADWEQGENKLTAWIARDVERLERLNTPGYDEHSEYGKKLFGCEVSKEVNKHLRDVAKVINHGRNYGMGPKHVQEELGLKGYTYSLGDVNEFINEWKLMNPGTAIWQQRTIALAQQQGYLANAFGRKRWFQSRDFANKALAFLPASTLADMMLRVVIALNPSQYRRELEGLGVGVVGQLPEGWELRWVVHDDFPMEGPHGEEHENCFTAARVLKAVLEQPWKELDGFSLTADLWHSNVSWGESERIEV